MKAEEYLRDMMTRYKNRLVYDATTGEIRDDRKYMTMTENYWLPRREGARGTEITTLQAGQNLGEMEDVKYFQKRLFKALNVPFTRMEPESTFSLGRAAEITREEVKFQRFIDRLRQKFSMLFLGCLEKQLIMKKIMTPEDWDQLSKQIKFKFARDVFFAELKDTEVLNDRLNTLNNIAPYAGKYFSHTWIRKNVLKQTDEDIEDIDKEISDEQIIPQYQSAMPGQEDMGGAGGFGGQQQSSGPTKEGEDMLPLPKPQSSFSQ